MTSSEITKQIRALKEHDLRHVLESIVDQLWLDDDDREWDADTLGAIADILSRNKIGPSYR